MPVIQDKEFGSITLRRSAKASHVRLKVGPDGRLRASLPLYAPVFLVKRLINNSREDLRKLLHTHDGTLLFTDGMTIGKSHSLTVHPSTGSTTTVKRHKQNIVVSLDSSDQLESAAVQRQIREVVIDAIRLEAKSYLPKRLAYLAAQHGYSYQNLRFSHASGRWGSCSANGTISLNIALMQLPFELIDYVLLHELSHTQQMNHSRAFWQLVEEADPLYRQHRTTLKDATPSI